MFTWFTHFLLQLGPDSWVIYLNVLDYILLFSMDTIGMPTPRLYRMWIYAEISLNVFRCSCLQCFYWWINEGRKPSKSRRDLPKNEERLLRTICWYLHIVDQLIWKGVFNFTHHLFIFLFISIYSSSILISYFLIFFITLDAVSLNSLQLDGEVSSFQIYILTQIEMCFGI